MNTAGRVAITGGAALFGGFLGGVVSSDLAESGYLVIGNKKMNAREYEGHIVSSTIVGSAVGAFVFSALVASSSKISTQETGVGSLHLNSSRLFP